jgi:hypothetical protein
MMMRKARAPSVRATTCLGVGLVLAIAASCSGGDDNAAGPRGAAGATGGTTASGGAGGASSTSQSTTSGPSTTVGSSGSSSGGNGGAVSSGGAAGSVSTGGAAGGGGSTAGTGGSGGSGKEDGGADAREAGPTGGNRPDGAVAPDAGAGKQSLIWVWQGYASALSSIAANAKSFTHVSPALYQINYAYTSGVAKQVNTNDNYDGLSSAQVCQRVHAAGLKCVPLMYAGAGNFGTDQGIQNILNDAPAGTRNAFITAMVGEAETKGYDGYNLDWEVGNTGYAAYGTKLVSFLAAFKSALNQHDMTVSLDLGTWYVRQCTGSGGDGLVDLAQLGHSLDLAIIEAYSGTLGTTPTSCPATNPSQINCDKDFLSQLSMMCNLPPDVVSIGLISPGTNSFAPSALADVSRYGFTRVAVWPDDAQFLNASGMPQGNTWYSVLAGFLGK